MSAIYHLNVPGFCVGSFGPRVQWVWCSARDNIESRPRVQAVNACLRVTVNPSACTTKKLRKPQPRYLPPLWSLQVATETPPKLWSTCIGEQCENRAQWIKGLPVAPLFSSVDKDWRCQFSSELINLALYWIWSWWLMPYYRGPLIKNIQISVISWLNMIFLGVIP